MHIETLSHGDLSCEVEQDNSWDIQIIKKEIIWKNLYETIEPEKKLRYRYSYDYMHKVLEQLQKGGIRLASLLNEIYC